MPSLQSRDTLSRALAEYVSRLDVRLSNYTRKLDSNLDTACLNDRIEEFVLESTSFIRAIVISAESIAIIHGEYLERIGEERILDALAKILDRANRSLDMLELVMVSIQ